MLVTERPGRLRLVGTDGHLSAPLAGVPEVFARGQGGLLDVALDPGFEENRLVYLSYSEPGPDGKARTAAARGRLTDRGLEDVRVIYRQEPKVAGDKHFGSRLVFGRDGTLFITQGERFDYMKQAQDLSSLLGKIVRIDPDGSIPKDNPFVGRADARPEIWSYWDPVIAPSGMVFYTGDAFPGWNGSILVGALRPGRLVRLTLQNGRVAEEHRYLAGLDERIRDVRQAPDGSIYLLTDSPKGRILRVQPTPAVTRRD